MGIIQEFWQATSILLAQEKWDPLNIVYFEPCDTQCMTLKKGINENTLKNQNLTLTVNPRFHISETINRRNIEDEHCCISLSVIHRCLETFVNRYK